MDWFSSPIAAENDAELIRRLRQRNTEGMGELYERYGKLLFALILNIVGDRQAAEDLLAETLLKASNRIREFETDSISVGPWLLILARNHALNFRLEALNRPANTEGWSKLEATSLYSAGPPGHGTFPATETARDAFVNLAPEDRLILELAWFEAMTFDEISARLERPVQDIEASAIAALNRLRET